jgi:monofunctional biosynthetic peptidoglycan transglycosylase
VKRLLAAGALILLSAIGYAAFTIATLPDVSTLRKTNPTLTAMMEQRASERHVNPRPIRTWVGYNSISPHLRNAVLIAEDSAFFQHSG